MKNSNYDSSSKSAAIKIGTKITVLVLVSVLVSISLISIITYFHTYRMTVNNLGNRAASIAKLAAEAIDPDKFKQLQTSSHEETEAFKNIVKELEYIKEVTGSAYLYTMRKNQEGKYIYVVDSDYYQEDGSGIGEVEDTVYPGFEEVSRGELYKSTKITDDDWGTLIYAYHPIKDHAGTTIGFVGADLDVKAEYLALLSLRWSIFITAILLAGIMTSATIFYSNHLFKPIKTMVNIADNIAQLNLTEDIPVKFTQRKDEIGVLSNAFQQTTDSLRAFIKKVEDSSKQVVYASEQLSATSQQTSATAEHISHSSGEVAQSVEKQLQEVVQANESIVNIADSIQNIAVNTQKINTLSSKAFEKSDSGKDYIKSASSQMKNIHDSTGEVKEALEEITSNSKKMNEIVDLIKNIAEQTNLLALNAAIEAARAGEQGRGFAVVAEEVKLLAEESQRSTEEIRTLITGSQSSINSANDLMEQNAQNVTGGISIVNSLGHEFIEIADLIKEISLQVQAITDFTENVSQNVENVVEAAKEIEDTTTTVSGEIQNISAATEEQTASLQEVSSSTQSLTQLAEDLRKAIEKFKI
jgi:methyl-accepting chemotaxis protein